MNNKTHHHFKNYRTIHNSSAKAFVNYCPIQTDHLSFYAIDPIMIQQLSAY